MLKFKVKTTLSSLLFLDLKLLGFLCKVPQNADERVALLQHRRAAEQLRQRTLRLEKVLAEKDALFNKQQRLLLKAQERLPPAEYTTPKLIIVGLRAASEPQIRCTRKNHMVCLNCTLF